MSEDVREAGEGSGSSFSEVEGSNDAETKIARSVTDGELRHRVLSPLTHNGVSTEEPLFEEHSLCVVNSALLCKLYPV